MVNLDELIRHYQREEGISDAEVEAIRQEARNASPLVAISNDMSYLIYDSMAKEFTIKELEKQNAELTYMLMMGGMANV